VPRGFAIFGQTPILFRKKEHFTPMLCLIKKNPDLFRRQTVEKTRFQKKEHFTPILSDVRFSRFPGCFLRYLVFFSGGAHNFRLRLQLKKGIFYSEAFQGFIRLRHASEFSAIPPGFQKKRTFYSDTFRRFFGIKI